METTRPVDVSEVHHTRRVSPPGNEDLKAEIAKLSARLINLERSRSRVRGNQHDRNYRFRSTSKHRSKSNRRTPESPDWLCYYHFKFRKRANKCAEPCAWKKQAAESTPAGN